MVSKIADWRRLRRLAPFILIAIALTVIVSMTVGIYWGFVGLIAFWISANVVFWFKRHPPPPSAFRGGRKD